MTIFANIIKIINALKFSYAFKLIKNCQVVSIWHSHLGSLVEQMVASHRKEAEQGAELSPRPSFPSKSAGGGGHSHQLGKYNIY